MQEREQLRRRKSRRIQVPSMYMYVSLAPPMGPICGVTATNLERRAVLRHASADLRDGGSAEEIDQRYLAREYLVELGVHLHQEKRAAAGIEKVRVRADIIATQQPLPDGLDISEGIAFFGWFRRRCLHLAQFCGERGAVDFSVLA